MGKKRRDPASVEPSSSTGGPDVAAGTAEEARAAKEAKEIGKRIAVLDEATADRRARVERRRDRLAIAERQLRETERELAAALRQVAAETR